MEVPWARESNPLRSANQSHSSENVRSLTCGATKELPKVSYKEISILRKLRMTENNRWWWRSPKNPIYFTSYDENSQNHTQEFITVEQFWKEWAGPSSCAHRALSLTFLLDWGADTATPVAGALSSFPTVLVYVALRHTDTYIMRKDRVEMLTLNQYLSWSSHRGTAETNP